MAEQESVVSSEEDAPKATDKKTPKVIAHQFPKKAVAIKAREKSSARGAKKSTKKQRIARSFPSSTFEEALTVAQAIHQFGAGQKMRRLTLFDKIKKAPDSGPSRQMVTNSSKYGLTLGGYQAEHLDLTPDGRIATDPEAQPQDRLKARFKLAIENVPPFKLLYERFKGNKLPTQAVLHDLLSDEGYPPAELARCVDTFILNAKYLGLLATVAGAERLLPLEHVLEESFRATGMPTQVNSSALSPTVDMTDWSKVCFYITPIGEPDSEQRKHSDLFLNHIVEPALKGTDLNVIRADQIGKAGMIGGQIVEHVLRSRLVIADLSFHNPNVFYELSLRHACGLPTVQLIRSSEDVPFDLDQVRTIRIDTTDIFTLVPRLETYRSEIANQVRRALQEEDSTDNPLRVFCPELKVSFARAGS
jgi:hypothetical protein